MSRPSSNLRIKLVSRPTGRVSASSFLEETVPVPELKSGEFLCKLIYMSVDPAMRGWMSADTKSYIEPVELGDIMRASGISQVIESKNEKFPVGAFVTGILGAQEYLVTDGTSINLLQMPQDSKMPLSAFNGPLGMTGLAAYFGLLRVGEPKAGETLLVSGAAGATGSVVGQIGKIMGCRVGKCRDNIAVVAVMDLEHNMILVVVVHTHFVAITISHNPYCSRYCWFR